MKKEPACVIMVMRYNNECKMYLVKRNCRKNKITKKKKNKNKNKKQKQKQNKTKQNKTK